MEWYEVLTTTISILSLPTIAGLIWKDLYDKKKRDHNHVNQLRNDENREKLREIIKEEIDPLHDKVDSLVLKIDKIGDGTLSSLRDDILTCYYRCHAKGYRNDYDYQNIHDLYQAYEGLHGNSFVKDIMDRFDALPTKELYRQKHSDIIGGQTDGEE